MSVQIIGIRYYQSFEQILHHEKLKNVLPGVRTYEDGVLIYHQFYQPSDETQYGVIALEMSSDFV